MDSIIKRLKNKASQSICRYKIAAMGFTKTGNLVGIKFNRPQFMNHGGGVHAEMNLMRQYGKKIRYIYICRVSKTGTLLKISPCKACKKKADSLNIKIMEISTK